MHVHLWTFQGIVETSFLESFGNNVDKILTGCVEEASFKQACLFSSCFLVENLSIFLFFSCFLFFSHLFF